MPINIRGKEYHTVAERVDLLDAKYNGRYSIETDKVEDNDKYVEVKATLTLQASSGSGYEPTIHQGQAREYYNAGPINKTSALENAETSAIGRALAAANLSGSGEYASANEMRDVYNQTSNSQQQQPDEPTISLPVGNKITSRLKNILGKYEADEIYSTLIAMRGGDKLSDKKVSGFMKYYMPESEGVEPPQTIEEAFRLVKSEGWKPFTITSLDWTSQEVDSFISLLRM